MEKYMKYISTLLDHAKMFSKNNKNPCLTHTKYNSYHVLSALYVPHTSYTLSHKVGLTISILLMTLPRLL